MDSHIADDKLKQLHIEDTTVKSNRDALQYELDPIAEKKLLRKIDWHVVPILWFLFMLAFLDRTNIGNARIAGMTEDLKMDGNDYNVALFTFFITYILFEVPSNIILKRVAPSTWLAAIMALWGIATVGQGLVTNQAGLVAMRLLLGLVRTLKQIPTFETHANNVAVCLFQFPIVENISLHRERLISTAYGRSTANSFRRILQLTYILLSFEAGFFPGCVYLISMYYKRYELQWRLNLFFCGAILAGAFSGLLAYALTQLDGLGGYEGWRWIFIIEGIITVGVAIISKWLIPDWPETASFLTIEERTLLIARLSADVADAKMNRLDGAARKRVFTDWKIYCGIVMYIGIVNTGYATSFFTPTIIRDLGYTAQAAQVRSIPVFVVATVVSLVVAWCADKARHRFGFCILGICMASVGYVILLVQDQVSVGVRYFAIFIIVSGGYTCQPVTLAWIQNNMTGHYKRSISSAMMVGFGNCGGIVASNIFITGQAPRYPVGYGVSLGLLWVCAAACVVLLLGVKRENKKRDRGERDWRLDTPDADNLGDDHPHFRFTI